LLFLYVFFPLNPKKSFQTTTTEKEDKTSIGFFLKNVESGEYMNIFLLYTVFLLTEVTLIL
jgi:hypothetical protein